MIFNSGGGGKSFAATSSTTAPTGTASDGTFTVITSAAVTDVIFDNAEPEHSEGRIWVTSSNLVLSQKIRIGANNYVYPYTVKQSINGEWVSRDYYVGVDGEWVYSGLYLVQNAVVQNSSKTLTALCSSTNGFYANAPTMEYDSDFIVMTQTGGSAGNYGCTGGAFFPTAIDIKKYSTVHAVLRFNPGATTGGYSGHENDYSASLNVWPSKPASQAFPTASNTLKLTANEEVDQSITLSLGSSSLSAGYVGFLMESGGRDPVIKLKDLWLT